VFFFDKAQYKIPSHCASVTMSYVQFIMLCCSFIPYNILALAACFKMLAGYYANELSSVYKA